MLTGKKFLAGFTLGAFCMFAVAWYLLGQPQPPVSTYVTLQADGSCTGQGVCQDLVIYHSIDEILSSQYYDVEDIDQEKMREQAIKGYVNALGDYYTTYMSAREATMFDEGMEGSQDFEGIGAIVAKKDEGIVLEEVLKGMPAQQAGLQHLDIVLEIDGESTQSMDVYTAVEKIRGPKGSEVALTVFREGASEVFEVNVVRDTVLVPSVAGSLVDLDGQRVLLIEIALFGEDVEKRFRDVLLEYGDAPIDGVILDLRANGGGLLPTAVDIASFFLPENELVTTARYSIGQDDTYRSHGFGNLLGVPTVVLQDELSASASEILAAALQERGGAKLVGAQSFGKGSIQTWATLSGGAALKYTIGKWYTPNENNVDKVGLEPDVEVEFDRDLFDDTEQDSQLERAKEVLLEMLP